MVYSKSIKNIYQRNLVMYNGMSLLLTTLDLIRGKRAVITTAVLSKNPKAKLPTVHQFLNCRNYNNAKDIWTVNIVVVQTLESNLKSLAIEQSHLIKLGGYHTDMSEILVPKFIPKLLGKYHRRHLT